MAKALVLTSGGLDSILAAKLLKDQGVDVTGVCFKSAFFGSKNAEEMLEQIDIPLEVIDFTDEHLEMVKHPKNGYGKNMNPCIDCHAMMLRYAGEKLKTHPADFLATGEVLNQRPMSQNRKALDTVREESGYEDKILRPLCAQCLPETQMEKDGLVDRSRLLNISGKSRKPQIALAEQMRIKDYPSPAGGCLLTEPQFSDRLRDLFVHGKKEVTAQDIELLKIGRHFRLSPTVKAVSTRDEEEYSIIKTLYRENDVILNAAEFSGSTVLLRASKDTVLTNEDIAKAAGIAAWYSKGKNNEQVVVRYRIYPQNEFEFLKVIPTKEEEIKKFLL